MSKNPFTKLITSISRNSNSRINSNIYSLSHSSHSFQQQQWSYTQSVSNTTIIINNQHKTQSVNTNYNIGRNIYQSSHRFFNARAATATQSSSSIPTETDTDFIETLETANSNSKSNKNKENLKVAQQLSDDESDDDDSDLSDLSGSDVDQDEGDDISFSDDDSDSDSSDITTSSSDDDDDDNADSNDSFDDDSSDDDMFTKPRSSNTNTTSSFNASQSHPSIFADSNLDFLESNTNINDFNNNNNRNNSRFTPQYNDTESYCDDKLMIRNLSYVATQGDLWDLCSQYGTVIDCYIPKDQNDSNRTRGYGFVTFQSSEEASSAMEQLQDAEFQSRRLGVMYAKQKNNQRSNRNFDNNPRYERRNNFDNDFDRNNNNRDMSNTGLFSASDLFDSLGDNDNDSDISAAQNSGLKETTVTVSNLPDFVDNKLISKIFGELGIVSNVNMTQFEQCGHTLNNVMFKLTLESQNQSNNGNNDNVRGLWDNNEFVQDSSRSRGRGRSSNYGNDNYGNNSGYDRGYGRNTNRSRERSLSWNSGRDTNRSIDGRNRNENNIVEAAGAGLGMGASMDSIGNIGSVVDSILNEVNEEENTTLNGKQTVLASSRIGTNKKETDEFEATNEIKIDSADDDNDDDDSLFNELFDGDDDDDDDDDDDFDTFGDNSDNDNEDDDGDGDFLDELNGDDDDLDDEDFDDDDDE